VSSIDRLHHLDTEGSIVSKKNTELGRMVGC